jgi:hypothetical protein
MTHVAVTGHNAVMTMPYCPLPTQALIDSLSSAIDSVVTKPHFYVCLFF